MALHLPKNLPKVSGLAWYRMAPFGIVALAGKVGNPRGKPLKCRQSASAIRIAQPASVKT